MACTMARRQLVVGSAAAALAALAPYARAQQGFPPERWVNIVFTPTSERFADLYFRDGVYSMAAVRQFSWICRDFHANEWKWIHPWLMDLIFVLHWKYNKNLINIYSGYRSPQTNARIEGAALNSQHTRAMALDIHIPDIDNDAVGRDLKAIVYGGTGIYPGRAFTHFDFGPLRSWVG
jgi:uncharacterized protein YcbK (DUF882 family)